MKSYKIKKRSHRFIPYIAGEPVTSFEKPKLPLWYFSKIHKPNIFKRQSFILEQQQEQQVRPV
jgi:hypothetical protein